MHKFFLMSVLGLGLGIAHRRLRKSWCESVRHERSLSIVLFDRGRVMCGLAVTTAGRAATTCGFRAAGNFLPVNMLYG